MTEMRKIYLASDCELLCSIHVQWEQNNSSDTDSLAVKTKFSSPVSVPLFTWILYTNCQPKQLARTYIQTPIGFQFFLGVWARDANQEIMPGFSMEQHHYFQN